jgi:hypothetical protein
MIIITVSILLILSYVYRVNIPFPYNKYISNLLLGIVVFYLFDVFLKQPVNATLIVSIALYIGMMFVQDSIPSTVVFYLLNGPFALFNVGAFSLGVLISSLLAEKLVCKT